MNSDKTKQLCMEMFLDMIPKNIDIARPVKLDCYRTLSDSFDKPHINGEMRNSQLLDDKCSTDSLLVTPDLGTDMEVDKSSDTDKVVNTPAKSDMVVNKQSNGNVVVYKASDANIVKNKTSDDMVVDKPSDDMVVDKPSDDMAVDKPSDDMVVDKPSDDVVVVKPLEDMVVDKPSDDDIVDEPSNVDIVVDKSLEAECIQLSDLNKNDLSSTAESLSGFNHKQCTEMCDHPVENFNQQIKIECLQSLESLQENCEKQGLKFNDYVPDTQYEVDMIFNDEFFNGKNHYFVKWKNYSTECNTWEPVSHLKGCREIIEYYNTMKSSKAKVNKRLLHYFVKDLTTRKPCDLLTLTKVCTLCFCNSLKHVDPLQLTSSEVKEMKLKVKEILDFSDKKISKLRDRLFDIMQYGESRKRVLINLKEWEYEINSKNLTAYIEVENNADLETAPAKFEFIHDYVSTIVSIPEEPVAFCHCENCYDNRKSCCPPDSEGHFAYSRHRRLLLAPGYPIYECNKLCKCGSDCINRNVQHGQKVKVCIFRTSNGCGWGLKTLETIEKGQFVLEYLGEIITSEEAESRGKIYDYVGRSYLFDLDYGVEDCSYTIDAGHAGNVAHFINHSCDPNLHVFAVWINHPDPNLPRLAFFAKRKIRRGEELTFDYKMVQKDRFGPLTPLPGDDRLLCHCKSKNCRKFLF